MASSSESHGTHDMNTNSVPDCPVCRGYCIDNQGRDCERCNGRGTLSALPAIPDVVGLGTVSVKLDWVEYPNTYSPDVFGHFWDAETPFIRYTIEEVSGPDFDSDTPRYEVNRGRDCLIGTYLTLVEAKDAAQSDFETRVKFCLTSIGAEAGWRTIDSAPKDWSDVLVYDPNFPSDFRKSGEAYHNPETGKWRTPSSRRALNPTHWQPLPAAPEASS